MSYYKLSEKGKTWFDGKGNYITLDQIEGHVITEEELKDSLAGFAEWCAKSYCPTNGKGFVTWTKEYYQNKGKIYSTADLVDIYQQHIKDKE